MRIVLSRLLPPRLVREHPADAHGHEIGHDRQHLGVDRNVVVRLDPEQDAAILRGQTNFAARRLGDARIHVVMQALGLAAVADDRAAVLGWQHVGRNEPLPAEFGRPAAERGIDRDDELVADPAHRGRLGVVLAARVFGDGPFDDTAGARIGRCLAPPPITRRSQAR